MTESIGEQKGEIVIYRTEDGQTALNVTLEEQTVWLTQAQMAKLFGKGRTTVTEHIRKVFEEKELEEKSVCRNFRHTARDGKTYTVRYYNLDMIISVGYRVKSKRGTQFRIWATNVLREHLVRGYTLNEKRLRESKLRLKELEAAVELVEKAKSAKALSNPESAAECDDSSSRKDCNLNLVHFPLDRCNRRFLVEDLRSVKPVVTTVVGILSYVTPSRKDKSHLRSILGVIDFCSPPPTTSPLFNPDNALINKSLNGFKVRNQLFAQGIPLFIDMLHCCEMLPRLLKNPVFP
jgi:hypothetical protein